MQRARQVHESVWSNRPDSYSIYDPSVEGEPGRYNAGGAAPPPGDDLMAAIRAFYEYMNMPIDQLIASGDAGAMGIQNSAYAAANRDARNRGIDGPMAVRNTQQTTSNALTAYDTQRKGLGMQALGLANNRDMGMQHLDWLKTQDARNRQDAQNFGNYGQGMNWGSAIGGVLGGGLGVGLAALTGGLATPALPALVGAGMGIGSGLGGSIGGSASGGIPAPSTARGGSYSGW